MRGKRSGPRPESVWYDHRRSDEGLAYLWNRGAGYQVLSEVRTFGEFDPWRESQGAIAPYQDIQRRASRRVYVGKVPVGDGASISVQTMTNTLTTDVAGTVAQIRRAEGGRRRYRPRLLPGSAKCPAH